ncbi:MAG: thioredoxin domain-containing protein [Polyangiaceae bacterium]
MTRTGWIVLRLLAAMSLLFAWSACSPPAPASPEGEAPVVAEVEPASPESTPIQQVPGVTVATERGGAPFPIGHERARVPVYDDDPTWGDPLAPVTVVAFSDFQCPYCGKVTSTLEALREVYGPRVLRIVWKDYPLPFHKDAPAAHAAARAVFELGGDDAFWGVHDRLFDNQRALTEPNMTSWAQQVGVPVDRFVSLSRDPRMERRVEESVAVGKEIGVRGTPAFFINGEFLSGARPQSAFEEVIDAEIAEATKLTRRGTPKHQIYVERAIANFDVVKPTPTPSPTPSPSADSTTVWKIPVHRDDPTRGNKHALVTIVQFSEFQCPFCKRVAPTLEQLLADYGKDLRLVWKDNPLPFHKQAHPAATLAREVYAQKGDAGFWKIHDILFANQKALEEPDLLSYGKQVGANEWRLKNALTKNVHDKVISRSQDEASDFEASGTPHFFINGRRLVGAQPAEKFKAIIDEEIVRAKQLLAGGTPPFKLYDELVENGKAPPPPEKKTVGAPPKDAPFRGARNAKVVIQVFTDFQCPFCSRVTGTLDAVMKTHGKRVKLVYRHKPLPFHKDAPLAHEAAVEAYVQKGNAGFWAMHDKLFENQRALTRPDLEQYASEIGLDMRKFNAALDTRRHEKRVKADVDASDKAGIRGTPGFTVNGYFISGAQPEAKFDKVIRRALREAP